MIMYIDDFLENMKNNKGENRFLRSANHTKALRWAAGIGCT